MTTHTLTGLVLGAVVCGASGVGVSVRAAGPASTAPAPGSPDAVFADKHLTKVGFFLEVPQEAEAHRAAAALRALQLKVANEGLARAATERALTSTMDGLIATQSQLAAMDAQLKAVKGDPDRYNQLVAPYNALVRAQKQQVARLEGLKKRQAAQVDSSPAYGDAALSAGQAVEAAIEAYDAVGRDADVRAAMAAYNKTAAVPLKLGPSGVFAADVAYVGKCVAEVAAAAIPVDASQGVPVVEALLDGKLTQAMVWDSGAGIVELSAATAKKLGMVPTDRDRTIHITQADGKKFDAKLMTVDAITLGAYTVEHVPCVVPVNAEGTDLLGNPFQGHFLCRLDLQAGALHLTPAPGDKDVKQGRPTTAPSAAAADVRAAPTARP